MSRRVSIVGAGVIGLTVAHELAAHGDTVTVFADEDTMHTVSAVSAALWFPYRSERSELADRMLTTSLSRFTALTDDPDSGVRMRQGMVIERFSNTDRSWTTMLPEFADVDHARLPVGAVSGVQATLPFIEIPSYLPWLRSRAQVLGVKFVVHTVSSIADLADDSDLVVLAAGIRGGELIGGDDTVYPVRGQIVRLANPGLEEWITDDDNPDGLTYVFPREHDVVVGGTAIEGAWNTDLDELAQSRILERARKLVPALIDQPVLGSVCGLRPARPSISLGWKTLDGVPIITAYGHGGAGVTLSWGTAERVKVLADGG